MNGSVDSLTSWIQISSRGTSGFSRFVCARQLVDFFSFYYKNKKTKQKTKVRSLGAGRWDGLRGKWDFFCFGGFSFLFYSLIWFSFPFQTSRTPRLTVSVSLLLLLLLLLLLWTFSSVHSDSRLLIKRPRTVYLFFTFYLLFYALSVKDVKDFLENQHFVCLIWIF